MRIMIQVPAGLRTKVIELATQLEKEGNEVFISCENFYGACDLREHEAKALKIDKIIHFGHTKFMDSEIPVEYREVRENINVIPILEKNWNKLQDYKKIGLTASLQFLDSLKDVKEFLEKRDKEVLIENNHKALYPGQILGCNTVNVPKADVVVHVGSGKFHALGAAFKTKILNLNVEMGTLEEIDTSMFEKQKYAALGLVKHAKKFGILLSSKPGQFFARKAETLRKELKEKGKEAFILVMDEISPDKLLGIDCDCWINTACPRIGIEDRTRYDKPIVNFDELKEITFQEA